MYSPEQIKKTVEANLPGSQATVRDLTGTSDHFQLVVISDLFVGKGLVERHRMVYSAVGEAVGGEIHALSLKTLTSDESRKRT